MIFTGTAPLPSDREYNWAPHVITFTAAVPPEGQVVASIGRGKESDVRLMYDCTKHGKFVSRQHARIEQLVDSTEDQPKYAITDLDSANGTFVNWSRLKPHQQQLLKNGDVIHFGSQQSGEISPQFSYMYIDAVRVSNDQALAAPRIAPAPARRELAWAVIRTSFMHKIRSMWQADSPVNSVSNMPIGRSPAREMYQAARPTPPHIVSHLSHTNQQRRATPMPAARAEPSETSQAQPVKLAQPECPSALKQALQCALCGQLMIDPAILPCGHTACSMCWAARMLQAPLPAGVPLGKQPCGPWSDQQWQDGWTWVSIAMANVLGTSHAMREAWSECLQDVPRVQPEALGCCPICEARVVPDGVLLLPDPVFRGCMAEEDKSCWTRPAAKQQQQQQHVGPALLAVAPAKILEKARLPSRASMPADAGTCRMPAFAWSAVVKPVPRLEEAISAVLSSYPSLHKHVDPQLEHTHNLRAKSFGFQLGRAGGVQTATCCLPFTPAAASAACRQAIAPADPGSQPPTTAAAAAALFQAMSAKRASPPSVKADASAPAKDRAPVASPWGKLKQAGQKRRDRAGPAAVDVAVRSRVAQLDCESDDSESTSGASSSE